MLDKRAITKVKIHSEEWFKERLGKFTASEIHYLMGEKPWTEGALSYIYRKVGEDISGLPCRDDVDTNATRHGNLYEPEALITYAREKGIDFLVTQCLISPPDSRFSSTPDALVIKGETETHYNVETVETKCPYSYDAYIRLFLCNTPEDVKKEEKKYYWQVIDQMDNCGALVGHLVVYQPAFRVGKMKVITFRKMELRDQFKLLKERKEGAEQKFNEIRDRLLSQ